MGKQGDVMGKQGDVMGKQGDVMGKQGDVMGKQATREPEFDLDPRHDFEVLDVSGLIDREVRRLWRDVRDIVDEEMDGPLSLYFSEAERVLRDRIGGQGNLKPYMACLMAKDLE
jgi:hypothetical protein